VTPAPDHHTPSDLRGIESALERLARAERDAAPSSLEERVFLATRDRLLEGPEPIRIAHRSRSQWATLAVAASLAAAGAAALIMASRPGPQGTGVTAGGTVLATSLEDDVELWLSLRTPDEFQNVADRIDLLDTDAM
jgi:ferric-dicitrate binding protein FerR (iron transport regulator)